MIASRRAVVTGVAAAVTTTLTSHAVAAGPGSQHSHRGDHDVDAPQLATEAASAASSLPAMTPPLEFGYFRTWHDHAVDPSRPNRMSEVPAEVDVLFVFPDYTPADSPFWSTLRDEYVPILHSRGTRVVRTIGINAVLDTTFPNTAEGWKAHAEQLVNSLVVEHGLDGLDIDMENDLTEEETARAVGVFTELAKLIGPKSGTGKLFIYDTNRDGDVPLFEQTADCFDYVLLQAYGRPVEQLDYSWSTFAPHIPAGKFLPGFSFYEEYDLNRWNDTSEPFEESRAVAYADWQPEGGTKAGVFSYAIDRDGVAFLDDSISHTTYEWSKRIKQRMLASAAR